MNQDTVMTETVLGPSALQKECSSQESCTYVVVYSTTLHQLIRSIRKTIIIDAIHVAFGNDHLLSDPAQSQKKKASKTDTG